MGADREVNFDQLSSVSPKGGVLWNRDHEVNYLERVERRAKEQARTILEQAGRERAALLEESRGELARMQEKAEQQAAVLRAESQNLKNEAIRLHEEAGLLHAGAEEAGYAAGVRQAQAELTHFRAVMGEAVGAVLSAVHGQCGRIFDAWKEDLCALLLACVEKGTGLVLDEDRARLLEQLLLDSVKLFEAHSSVLVRVQPGDEAVVADMFASAKERMPGLASWNVQGDPELAPGDLVLEAAHSRAESRIEERRSAVDAALRHVLLPVTPEEETGRADLARVSDEAVARMLELAPKRPFASNAPDEAMDGAEKRLCAGTSALGAGGTAYAAEPSALDAGEERCMEPQAPGPFAELDTSGEMEGSEAAALFGDAAAPRSSGAPEVDLRQIWGRRETASSPAADAADVAEALDAVLAEGGFLPVTGEEGR